MTELYHPSIYDTGQPIGSFWEETAGPPIAGWRPLEGDAACDVAIIGGGFTGLSAALHLARDFGVEARVLDAGPPGWGATAASVGWARPRCRMRG